MSNSAIKDPRRVYSQSGGIDSATDARITTLENNVSKISYFFSIAAGTTGTITIPTGATIILDQLYSGADAFVDTISGGQPTGLPPFTAGGVEVDVTSFDALGNYTLSGTPSAYPVALIYQLTIKEKDLGNLTTANILDIESQEAMPYLTGAAGTFIRGAGAGLPPIVSTLILPNAATVNQVVYATSANAYGASANLTYSESSGSQLTIINVTDGQAKLALSTPAGALSFNGGSDSFFTNSVAGAFIFRPNAGSETVRMTATGRLGIGTGSSTTALIHRKAGTATASTAPDKWTAGTLLTVIEALAGEVNAQGFYKTNVALNRYAEGGVIADFTADVNNSGTSETDFYSYTTKASTLAATGEKIEFTYTGTFNDITATARLKVLFAGTTIGDTGALTIGATGAWVINGWIIRTGASTARASVNISTPSGSTATYTAETDLTGLTFTNTNILKGTSQAGGAGGGDNDITSKLGSVWWWGAAANS